MPARKKDSVNEGIQATNVSAQAMAVGKGAKAIVNQNRKDDRVNQVFVLILQKVAELPDSSEKEIARNAIIALQAEAERGSEAKESNVAKWLNFLAQAAPDIWDVAISTFSNPIAGLSTVFKKVADRAKAEKGSKNT